MENRRFGVSGPEDFQQTVRKDRVKGNLSVRIRETSLEIHRGCVSSAWFLSLTMVPLPPPCLFMYSNISADKCRPVLQRAWRFSLADWLLPSRTCIEAEFSLLWYLSSSQTLFFTKPVACLRVLLFFQTRFKLSSSLGGWMSASWFAQALSL